MIGNSTLYLGNSIDMIASIEADSIVTDPPYGVGFADWDDRIPDWFDEARKVTRKIVFTTAPTTLWAYPKPDWLGCVARPGQTARTAQGGFNHWIPVMIYGVKFSKDMRYLPPTANVQTREYPPGYPHPCPKPSELTDWLVDESSAPGEVVFDPFMGSGTTGVSCVNLGRKFVGIEMNSQYFDLACSRIERATTQGRLFA